MVTFPPAGSLTLLKILAPTPVGAGQGAAGQGATLGQSTVGQNALPASATAQATPAGTSPAANNLATLLAAGTKHVGTVVAQGVNNTLTLNFGGNKSLHVQAGQPLPVGAKVSIEILPNGTAKILDIQIPTTILNQQTFSQFATGWQQLATALAILHKHVPTSGNRLLGHIPSGRNFLPAMLAFNQAVFRQDPAQFLGSGFLERLQQMGVDLGDNLTALNRLTQPSEEGWRTLIFPYLEQEDDSPPRQGQFFWHTEEKEEGAHTRFLLNLEFTKIGQIQLDGLLHVNQLNLKLRLPQMPHPAFEQELSEIVQNSLAESNLTGSIQVLVTTQFLPIPVKNLLQSSHHLNVTI